mmetsp:Transcript_9485/g.19419  ORF Transcript_9485/g.19419 Transcript_9485/m.19419 type:complete len:310 (+) Transcript_9485:110-1039(+)
MSVDAASLRTVAVQLRALSSDPENQPIIAREEGCLAALVSFITRQEDPEICRIAVTTVLYLSSHADNHDLLRAEEELVEGLKDLWADADADPDVRKEVRKIFANILSLEDITRLEVIAKQQDQITAKDSTSDSDSVSPGLARAKQIAFEQTEEAERCRIQVPGISDEEKQHLIESEIIQIKGIVSISFEVGNEVVVLYSKVPRDALVQILQAITNSADMELLEDDRVERELEPQEVDPRGSDGYIDEAKERYNRFVREQQRRSTLIHGGNNSLAARLEEGKRAEERKAARAGRLLNRIGKGFQSGWGFW